VIRIVVVLFLVASALVPSAAGAQTLEDYDYENLQFRGIGLDLGAVFPSQVESDLFLGVRADLGFLGPNLRIVPGISFWSSNLKQTEVDRLGDQIIRVCSRQPSTSCPGRLDLGRIRRSDLVINADALYEFETPLIATPYLGGGVGVHLLNGSGESINDTFIEDLLDAITPGINLIAGLTIPVMSDLRIFGEARYVLVSDVRHGALSVGGIWNFVPPRNPLAR
jgi:hypothetical protein